jgi:hypothetical protein
MPPDMQLLIEGLALRRPPPTIASLSLPDGGNALWLEQAPNCLRLDVLADPHHRPSVELG